jgi:hypothetical protein
MDPVVIELGKESTFDPWMRREIRIGKEKFVTIGNLIVWMLHCRGYYGCQSCKDVKTVLKTHKLPDSWKRDTAEHVTAIEYASVQSALYSYIRLKFDREEREQWFTNDGAGVVLSRPRLVVVKGDGPWAVKEPWSPQTLNDYKSAISGIRAMSESGKITMNNIYGVAIYDALQEYGDMTVIEMDVAESEALEIETCNGIRARFEKYLGLKPLDEETLYAIDFIVERANKVLPNLDADTQFSRFIRLHRESKDQENAYDIPVACICVLAGVEEETKASMGHLSDNLVVVEKPVESMKELMEFYITNKLSTSDVVLFHGVSISDKMIKDCHELAVYRAPLLADDVRRMTMSRTHAPELKRKGT